MSIEFPRTTLPTKAQVIFSPARAMIFEWCSPRSFRVESGLAWLAERALSSVNPPKESFWWIGPDYSATIASLGLFKAAMTPGTYEQQVRSTNLKLINGATLSFKSAENTSGLYADDVAAAVVDNAVKIPEKAWYALRETFANTRAKYRIISTVEGKANWFNGIARQAESEPSENLAWVRFTVLDARDAGLISQEDLDFAQASLPNHIYRAMYLAEPYDDRIEAAHRASDPRLMFDEELAIIANIEPSRLDETSDEELRVLAAT